jgi:hypothetical protein
VVGAFAFGGNPNFQNPTWNSLMALNPTNAFNLFIGQQLFPLSLCRDSVGNVVTAA